MSFHILIHVHPGKVLRGHGGGGGGGGGGVTLLVLFISGLKSPPLALSSPWGIPESGHNLLCPQTRESGISPFLHEDLGISPSLVPTSCNDHLLCPLTPGFHRSHVTPPAGGLCPSHSHSHPALRGHFGQGKPTPCRGSGSNSSGASRPPADSRHAPPPKALRPAPFP